MTPMITFNLCSCVAQLLFNVLCETFLFEFEYLQYQCLSLYSIVADIIYNNIINTPIKKITMLSVHLKHTFKGGNCPKGCPLFEMIWSDSSFVLQCFFFLAHSFLRKIYTCSALLWTWPRRNPKQSFTFCNFTMQIYGLWAFVHPD